MGIVKTRQKTLGSNVAVDSLTEVVGRTRNTEQNMDGIESSATSHLRRQAVQRAFIRQGGFQDGSPLSHQLKSLNTQSTHGLTKGQAVILSQPVPQFFGKKPLQSGKKPYPLIGNTSLAKVDNIKSASLDQKEMMKRKYTREYPLSGKQPLPPITKNKLFDDEMSAESPILGQPIEAGDEAMNYQDSEKNANLLKIEKKVAKENEKLFQCLPG